MNELKQKVLSYWVQLRPREQVLLSIAGTLLIALILYASAWKPLQMATEDLKAGISKNIEDLNWMRMNSAEARQLQRSGNRSAQSARGGSMLANIDSTAKSAGLGQYVRRVEPEGNERVRVWFEKAPFDDLSRWLKTMTVQYGYQIETASLDRSPESGRVGARLVFKGSSS